MYLSSFHHKLNFKTEPDSPYFLNIHTLMNPEYLFLTRRDKSDKCYKTLDLHNNLVNR